MGSLRVRALVPYSGAQGVLLAGALEQALATLFNADTVAVLFQKWSDAATEPRSTRRAEFGGRQIKQPQKKRENEAPHVGGRGLGPQPEKVSIEISTLRLS